VDFVPSNPELFVSGDADGLLYIWTMSQQPPSYSKHKLGGNAVKLVRSSPNRPLVAVAVDNILYIIDTSGTAIASSNTHSRSVGLSVAFFRV